MTRNLVLASSLAFFACTVTTGPAQQERTELRATVQRLEERLQRMDQYLQSMQTGQQQAQEREKTVQQMQQEMAELRAALRKREEEAAGARDEVARTTARLQAELGERERGYAKALDRQKLEQAKAQEDLKKTAAQLQLRVREGDEQARKSAEEAKGLRTALERTRAEADRVKTEAAATQKKEQEQRERRLRDLEDRAVKAEAAGAEAMATADKVRAEAAAAQKAAAAARKQAEDRVHATEHDNRRESAQLAERADLLAKISAERAMLQDLRASTEKTLRQETDKGKAASASAAKRIADLERANAELRAALEQARKTATSPAPGKGQRRNPDREDDEEDEDGENEAECEGCAGGSESRSRSGCSFQLIIHNNGGEVHFHLHGDAAVAAVSPTPVVEPPAAPSRPNPRLGTAAPRPRMLGPDATADATYPAALEPQPLPSSSRVKR